MILKLNTELWPPHSHINIYIHTKMCAHITVIVHVVNWYFYLGRQGPQQPHSPKGFVRIDMQEQHPHPGGAVAQAKCHQCGSQLQQDWGQFLCYPWLLIHRSPRSTTGIPDLRHLYFNSSSLFSESQSQLLNRKGGEFSQKLSSVTLITDGNSKWPLGSQNVLPCALQRANKAGELSVTRFFCREYQGTADNFSKTRQNIPEPALRSTKLLYIWHEVHKLTLSDSKDITPPS